MDIGLRPHVCGVSLMILKFVLTLADGSCCTWCWCPETGTSSVDWAQLSRFHLKTETESSLRNVASSK
jgi:hypothetical protein